MAPPAIPGDWSVHYQYAVGPTTAQFFAALKERGAILASRCVACGRVLLPPRSFCERCFEHTRELVEVGPEGTVQSYTLPATPISTPSGDHRMIALIQLDGADSGLIHFVGGMDVDDPAAVLDAIKAGLRVVADFRPQNAREGSILDIACFRPTEARLA